MGKQQSEIGAAHLMTSEDLKRNVMVGCQAPLEWIWLRGQFPIPNPESRDSEVLALAARGYNLRICTFLAFRVRGWRVSLYLHTGVNSLHLRNSHSTFKV